MVGGAMGEAPVEVPATGACAAGPALARPAPSATRPGGPRAIDRPSVGASYLAAYAVGRASPSPDGPRAAAL